MKTPDDGGSAFPVPITFNPNDNTPVHAGMYFDGNGMTLRDYFAAKALQMIVINDTSQRPENFLQYYSEGAYAWADAMIEARKNFIK